MISAPNMHLTVRFPIWISSSSIIEVDQVHTYVVLLLRFDVHVHTRMHMYSSREQIYV